MDTGTQVGGDDRGGLRGDAAVEVGSPTLIEIRLPRKWWIRRRLAEAVLGVLVVGYLLYQLGNSPSNNPFALLLVFALVALVYVFYGRSHLAKAPGAPEQESPPAELPTPIDARFPRQVPIERLLRDPKRAARMLTEAGVRGLALRLSAQGEKERERVEAFVVPFEPLPLEEGAEETLAMAGGLESSAGGETGRRGRSRSEWCGLVLRHSDLGLLAMLTVGALIMDLVAGQLWATAMSYVYGIWPWVMIACVWAGLGKLLRGTRLYIIPGGLIDVRRRRAYLRSEGVLVWYPETETLQVTDGEDVFEPAVTRKEALLAMRAWLSPVPVPTDEMIVAFLLGRS